MMVLLSTFVHYSIVASCSSAGCTHAPKPEGWGSSPTPGSSAGGTPAWYFEGVQQCLSVDAFAQEPFPNFLSLPCERCTLFWPRAVKLSRETCKTSLNRFSGQYHIAVFLVQIGCCIFSTTIISILRWFEKHLYINNCNDCLFFYTKQASYINTILRGRWGRGGEIVQFHIERIIIIIQLKIRSRKSFYTLGRHKMLQ